MQHYRNEIVFNRNRLRLKRNYYFSHSKGNLRNNNMKTSVVGYWNYKKEKLKQKFEILTEKDLSFNEGKEKEMIEMLGYKLGKTKQELLSIIISL
jgi:adenylate cyclase class IV